MKCLKCAYATWFNPDIVIYAKAQEKAGLCWGHYQDHVTGSPQAREEVRL